MSGLRSLSGILVIGVFLAGTASAAVVQFDVQSAANPSAVEVVVQPGSVVPYRITALVSSPEPATTDNAGLSFFRVHLLTDTGIVQTAPDAFDPAVAAAFPLLASLGRADGDDVLDIKAGQDVLLGSAPLVENVGVGTAQVLVTGSIATPAVEGVFTVIAATDSEASVFALPDATEDPAVTVSTGAGLRIITAFDAPTDDDTDPDAPVDDSTDGETPDDGTTDDGTGTDIDDGTDTDEGTNTSAGSDPFTEAPIATAMAASAAVAAITLGVYLLIGPMAGAFTLIFALFALLFTAVNTVL